MSDPLSHWIEESQELLNSIPFRNWSNFSFEYKDPPNKEELIERMRNAIKNHDTNKPIESIKDEPRYPFKPDWMAKFKRRRMMKKILKSKWLYVSILGVVALALGGTYADQIGRLILQLVGGE